MFSESTSNFPCDLGMANNKLGLRKLIPSRGIFKVGTPTVRNVDISLLHLTHPQAENTLQY